MRSRVDEIYAVYVPSEQQDPIFVLAGAISVLGHKDQFPPLRLSARSLLGQATFAGTDGNGEEAPKLDISVKAVVLPLSTRRGIDTVLFVITGVPLVLRLIAGAFLGCNNGRRLPFQDGVFPLNVFKSWL